MKTNHHRFFLNKLKTCKIFSLIEEEKLEWLIQSCEKIYLKRDRILFNQNEYPDAMYILITGCLQALHIGKQYVDVVGYIKEGELVGEMGTISGQPRAFTIKALKKCILLKMSKEFFIEFIKKIDHPKFVLAFTLNLIERHQNTIKTLIHKKINHIFLVKINDEVDDNLFIENIKLSARSNKKIFFLDEKELKRIEEADLINYIDNLEKNYDTIFYHNIDLEIDSFSIILHRINIVFQLAIGNKRPHISNNYLKLFESKFANIQKYLILLWPPEVNIEGTRHWLALTNSTSHYHVVLNEQNDYNRLLRFFSNKAIGLVLSGGGARVWFHLGVIKTIIEQEIPIDAICGTSSGAGLAACFLKTKNFPELYSICETISNSIKKGTSWYSFTWPRVSVYSGAYVTDCVKEIFGNQRIEDLRIPYLAVSTNINTGLEYILTQGKVWEAVRASSAIPGIFPPLVKEGQLLFDGGLINNLPTDHMLKMLHGEGILIASDNALLTVDNVYYRFPSKISLFDLFFNYFKFKKFYTLPNFFEMLLRAMLSGAKDKHIKNVELATYYIKLDLNIPSLFIFDSLLRKKLLIRGYDKSKTFLSELNNKDDC